MHCINDYLIQDPKAAASATRQSTALKDITIWNYTRVHYNKRIVFNALVNCNHR